MSRSATSMNQARFVKVIKPWVRVAVGVALLWFLLSHTSPSDFRGILASAASHRYWILSGLLLTFLALVAGSIRWQHVLDVQGIHFTGWQALRIVFVGQFFNSFMLGACGGDMVRAYYAARGQPGKRAEATATIFVDRGIGLFTMIVFCCVMIVFRIRVFLDNDGPRDTGVLMILFLVLACLAIVILFQKNVFEHFEFFRRIESTPRLGPLIRRAYEAFFIYRGHHRTLFVAVVCSLLNLFLLTLACYCFGRALEIGRPPRDYFTLVPIISVISAVPLTPGSLGVRESLFVSLFRAVMVTKSHALLLSLMFYAGGVFWSLVGGLVYVAGSFGGSHARVAAFRDEAGSG